MKKVMLLLIVLLFTSACLPGLGPPWPPKDYKFVAFCIETSTGIECQSDLTKAYLVRDDEALQRITARPGHWENYTAQGGETCDDFNSWKYLSRYTCAEEEFCKFTNGQDCCQVPMVAKYDINREYCNFTEGDFIQTWIED